MKYLGRTDGAARTRDEIGRRVNRFWTIGLLLLSLCGCSAGGFVPNGPHTMDRATLNRIIAAESARSGVPASLLSAMIAVESGGDPSAVSRVGAGGLMQLMPRTATAYQVGNRFDPRDNVAGGTRYIRDLLVRYHNNVALALAAYNAGPGAVDAAGGIPPFPETRAYVARVTAVLRNT